MHRFYNVSNNLSVPGVPGLGLVPPAPVPLPVPVILAPGGPLPVAVAPVPPAAVPLAPATAPAAAAAAATVAPLKNGYGPSVASGTPPPPHENATTGAATSAPVVSQPAQQQQQPAHIPAQQQPRFLFAVNSLPGNPYGGPGQVQLYFPHATPFYTPTLPVRRLFNDFGGARSF